MMDFTRYAVYYTPEPGALADFGARWLGWDAVSGKRCDHPDVADLPIEEITRAPRKYGFHATIRPPFTLSPGSDRETLASDLESLCRELAPVTLAGLGLARLGGFLALTPVGDTSALSDLAAAILRGLDHHRAQPSEAELSRRRGKGLRPSQEGNLIRWGYPYVLEDFRFHLTLTGRLPRAQADLVMAALRSQLSPLLPAPLIIHELCLFGEAPDGKFRLISRHKLCG
ncbi:DUF1045 domain-containing protein [Alisedimentitalea sp. MJ-SS2]|uniref:DUF1045 domain-containing protein n=1 Tax=Aliisedimentitalea sp. MJ-SS2 TaxID=3049795 RepID=UPI00291254FD|nr:DUF1045 domain-containing protein [Alisedimentitalea sp. MJ-SS2]MDU8926507.1 DUF1045 domain-containing protein [Alisedimentitalea sp. MJ-SS2]